MPKRKNDPIKKPFLVEKFTQEQIDELIKCKDDFVYFVLTYCYIQHPKRGRVKFEPYDYQEEMLKSFLDYTQLIFMCGRQLGKTTCVALYILWRAIFQEDQTILIASNKTDSAVEVMDRIKYTYENLPDWLKPGVTMYNRKHVIFENSSEVITRSTTKDTGRGLSISLLYCDEFAAVDPPQKQREFWAAIRPVVSTGGECIITSTPLSDEDTFAQIWNSACDIFDEHGEENPEGIGKNGFKAVKFTWDVHPDRDEKWAETERAAIGIDRFEREHNCEFISQSDTLVDPIKLATLRGIDPRFKTGNVRWYSKPLPNKTYLVTLDPSMGTGNDYAAIEVFQLPELVQVAEWQHNKTAIHGEFGQIAVLLDILRYIEDSMMDSGMQNGEPEIYWTVENNGCGEAANAVIYDTGEDNFPGVYSHEPRKPGTKRTIRRKGYNTTNKSKLEACAKLKSLIERDKLTIYSKPLINELKNFVTRGPSYSAKTGEHDDLVSSTLLMVRLLEKVMKYEEEFEQAFSESLETENREPLPVGVLSTYGSEDRE